MTPVTYAERLIRSHKASGAQSYYLDAGMVLLGEITELRTALWRLVNSFDDAEHDDDNCALCEARRLIR